MALKLGLDTGGTYTDAVIHDDARGVLCRAKVLTTHDDLIGCVGEAIARVLAEPMAKGLRPQLVAVSTTLATNAIVEGHGGSACLMLIGQGAEALQRAGLGATLEDNPLVLLAGGHRASGEELAALDEGAVRAAVARHAGRVDAFAVAGLFAVRNPAHEQRVREIIRETCDKPVTCGHQLSARLDAPRRALTALLNARLVPLISELVDAVEQTLRAHGVDAPLMVVQGDGSLVAAPAARERPVETILSGPAASTVGARHLSREDDALVVDIGGTTTDIGVLHDGWPALSDAGAHVAGLPTMVAAIDAHTYGLGGDSEVHWGESPLRVGPQRAVPLSLLAREHPQTLAQLERQWERGSAHEYDARFALRRRTLANPGLLSYSEREIWRLLEDGPVQLEQLHERVASERPLRRLRARGLVALAAFTPSDAAHVLGFHDEWSRPGAELGARLSARCATLRGARAQDPVGFSERVVEALVRQSTEVIVDAVLRDEGESQIPLDTPLLARATGRYAGDSLLEVNLRLRQPLVAVGAAAEHYYPAIAERLHTRLAVPAHLDVANAVGAAVSGVLQRASALITLPRDDCFRVHAQTGTADFATLDAAADYASILVREQAVLAAQIAGAGHTRCETQRRDRAVTAPDGNRIFLESRITGIARGEPAP